MTPGGYSGRGYGHDDEDYAAYPAYRSAEAAPDYPPDQRSADYLGDAYDGSGYGAQAYGGSDYGGSDYGGSGYAGAGYQPPAGYPSAGQPPASGYSGAGYPGAGYPGSDQGRVGHSPETYRPAPEGFPPNGRYSGNGHHPADRRYPAEGRAVPRRRDPPAAAGGSGRRDRPSGTDQRERRRRLPLWQELPLLLVIAFCLAILIRTFLLQAFYIPSGSMEDTLIAGDRVLVNKVVYNFRDPARGEVVVFKGTDAWAPLATDDDDVGTFARIGRTLGDLVGISRPGEKDFIKRVIGVPGDVVSCCDVDGRVFVNGVPLDEGYVVRDSPRTESPDGVRDCRGREFPEVVVEPGQLFVMGDHRQRSQDSRCQGQVPIENVIGRAFVIVWPNDRWAGLSASDTFDDVPQPVAAAPAGEPGAAVPGQLGLILPLLLPLGFAIPSARSRLVRRDPGRRLAE